MFAPNKTNPPEDLGTIEVFGVSLGLIIGLKELGIEFIHVPTQPRSLETFRVSPFGTIPALVHRPNTIYSHGRDDVTLFEPLSIVNYIDEFLAPAAGVSSENALIPSLPDVSDASYATAILKRVEIFQLTAVVIERLQRTIGDHYVLPYFALRNNGATEADIQTALGNRVDKVVDSLILFEKTIKDLHAKSSVIDGQFIVGDRLSWADIFLFPILRDLRATNQISVLKGGENECVPWLTAWYERFEKRESAVASLHGSFASSV
ncbi:hypothetical protein MCUN1_002484 [Malassezia cuniculi]|uniref:GST C-terminal domain-containing protein n=1 Tax=Malassezia cuniculi TaxID=948313 RepID=A0AAF0JBT7_9BASI|nr:hypothetical protein MCUN1_002484 [Malassezia cuniculi]